MLTELLEIELFWHLTVWEQKLYLYYYKIHFVIYVFQKSALPKKYID